MVIYFVFSLILSAIISTKIFNFLYRNTIGTGMAYFKRRVFIFGAVFYAFLYIGMGLFNFQGDESTDYDDSYETMNENTDYNEYYETEETDSGIETG